MLRGMRCKTTAYTFGCLAGLALAACASGDGTTLPGGNGTGGGPGTSGDVTDDGATDTGATDDGATDTGGGTGSGTGGGTGTGVGTGSGTGGGTGTGTDTGGGTTTTTDTTGGGGSGGFDPYCGNGVMQIGEECDGADFGTETCATQGFVDGTLVCTQICTIETSQCSLCGNDIIDGGEDCDGTDLAGINNCADAGLGDAGEPVSCATDCTYDYSLCSGCGDGTINPPEQCEDADLGGATCESEGFDGGTLVCTSGCQFDSSGCYACGDGSLNGSEECDDPDFGGQTCSDFASPAGPPFTSGMLTCDVDECTISTEDCMYCGDDVASDTEPCDGADLLSQTCETLGFTQGTLDCESDCSAFDTSGCTECGDDTAEAPEECDGDDLFNQDCTDVGFDSGDLACDVDCALDTTGCIAAGCGDGFVNGTDECDCLGGPGTCSATELDNTDCEDLPSPGTGNYNGGTLDCNAGSCTFNESGCTWCGDQVLNGTGELCDDDDFGTATCITEGHVGGDLTCDASCQVDDSTCHDCGDGDIDDGESCDGSELGGEDCESQGFTGGTLECNSGCGFDTSGCTGDTCNYPSDPPGGGTCPPACTDCDFGTNTCIIECNSSNCDNVTIDCPADWACDVRCVGTSACRPVTINCPQSYACTILCDGTVPCEDAVFNCGDAICNVTCDATSPCAGATLNCGIRDSRLTCNRNATPEPTAVPDPGSTCACETTGC